MEGFRSSGLLGCGPSGGCGKLVSGRWSDWFGVPVSVPAALVYLGMLCSALRVRHDDRAWRVRPAGKWLALTTALAAAAATWFVMLNAAEKSLCPFCLCLHASGLAAAGPVWQRLRRWPRELLRPAGAALAVLIFGQLLAPRHPYRVQADVVTPAATGPRKALATGQPVSIIVDGRRFDLDPGRLPVLGSPTARHFIVVMSDYTCEHCRTTHRMLERSQDLFGSRIGVIVLPVLLDPSGNPYLPPGATHPLTQDRALTRLALSVFRADPTKFGEMNRWLFAEDRVRGEAETRAYAEQLIGADALRNAETDLRISEITLTGCELFARTGNGMLPKMLIGSTQISGAVEDPSVVLAAIGRQWKDGTVPLKPVGPHVR